MALPHVLQPRVEVLRAVQRQNALLRARPRHQRVRAQDKPCSDVTTACRFVFRISIRYTSAARYACLSYLLLQIISPTVRHLLPLVQETKQMKEYKSSGFTVQQFSTLAFYDIK